MLYTLFPSSSSEADRVVQRRFSCGPNCFIEVISPHQFYVIPYFQAVPARQPGPCTGANQGIGFTLVCVKRKQCRGEDQVAPLLQRNNVAN